MRGKIKNIIDKKNFGFIRGEGGIEYFFHREEFNGDWDDLADLIARREPVTVEFEATNGPKGPRAVGVYVAQSQVRG